MQIKTPAREESIARRCAELLRQGRYDEISSISDPVIVRAESRQRLIAIHDTLAQGEPASIKVIDAEKFRDGDAISTNIVLDYEFPPIEKTTGNDTEPLPPKWVFLTFSIRSTEDNSDSIVGISGMSSAQPIEAINAFTFQNKGLSQYTALAIGIILTAFTIYALVVCIRARIGSRKWLWLLFMLFTVSPVSVNWNTGHWSFHNIFFNFSLPPLPASLTCSAYGPWQLTLGLPIGAIAFVYHWKLRTVRHSQPTAVGTSGS